jgi:branched-chain amino acid transport system ATP-binding protein
MALPSHRRTVAPSHPGSMTPVLELEDVSKRFGSLEVTRGVNLALAEGARCALIGPNGAGKTTLINLIGGRLQPSAGSIRIDGRDVTRLAEPARVKAGVGRTFQITSLFRRLTLEENLALAVAEHGGVAGKLVPNRVVRAEVEARVAGIVSTLRLESAARTRVEVLPYGVQRMVELGIALALRPRLLLLDEPAAGVPRSEVGLIFEAVAQLPPSMAVLLVEHDIDVVFRFATRIAVLVAGSILVEGTPQEISDNPEVRRLYLGSHA